MTIRFLLDSNILSELHRPMPNVRVLQVRMLAAELAAHLPPTSALD